MNRGFKRARIMLRSDVKTTPERPIRKARVVLEG